jgi:hypothetical protein
MEKELDYLRKFPAFGGKETQQRTICTMQSLRWWKKKKADAEIKIRTLEESLANLS